MSGDQLYNEVYSHYTSQAIKQLYVLVLGLDVLGNPYGLAMGVASGVEAFFYEPIQVQFIIETCLNIYSSYRVRNKNYFNMMIY